MHPKRAEEIPTLLATLAGDRYTSGGGTLLDEPVVVIARGRPVSCVNQIFDQRGTLLATVARPVGRRDVPTDALLEIRDAQGGLVQVMQRNCKSWSTKWRYALSAPGSTVVASIDKIDRKDNCAVSLGPLRVGALKKFELKRVSAFDGPEGRLGYRVEDATGRQVADVRVARVRHGVVGRHQIDIVVEFEQRATRQMRWVALAAGVIVDSELLAHLDESVG